MSAELVKIEDTKAQYAPIEKALKGAGLGESYAKYRNDPEIFSLKSELAMSRTLAEMLVPVLKAMQAKAEESDYKQTARLVEIVKEMRNHLDAISKLTSKAATLEKKHKGLLSRDQVIAIVNQILEIIRQEYGFEGMNKIRARFQREVIIPDEQTMKRKSRSQVSGDNIHLKNQVNVQQEL